MCLSVPGKIIEIKGDNAVVDINGNKIEANIQLINDAKTGEYVLVHAGFAIEKIDEEEAKSTIELFDEYEKMQEK
jgi:hydrogenase expression/formation protein HypC